MAEVHRLTLDEASRHSPVHLRGVVTAISGWRNSFFLEDATGGISLDSDDHPTGVHTGDEIEVNGTSDPGKFAAIVRVASVRTLGRGHMPADRLVTYPQLASGLEDSNWIDVQGIVRSAGVKPLFGRPMLTLSIEIGGGNITAFVRDALDTDPDRLVDAVVRVRGVCSSSFNGKRQLTGVGMFVNGLGEVEIKTPAPSDPYSLPATPIQNVLRFEPGAPQGHRVKVVGTVTYEDPGHLLFLQQGDDGILLNIDQETPAGVGSTIEAIGFPELGAYAPVLRNVMFRPVGGVLPPQIRPVPMHAADFLQGANSFAFVPYDARLVRLRGEVIEKIPRLKDDLWLLRDGDSHFIVLLKHLAGVAPPAVAGGTIVEVTGVLMVQVDEDRRPTAFRLLLRRPADVVVVRRASWWTIGHTVQVLSAVVLVTLGALLWGFLLRRQVRRQTQMLRESEERFRSQAQHDTLTGLASRSYLQEKLAEAATHAARARSMLGVLMIDLDHFKQVNDTMGHHAGDELLRIIGGRIRASVRRTDLVARMGGDEFVVLLTELSHPAEAELVGAQVVASVVAPAEIQGRYVPVSASVGVCTAQGGVFTAEALLRNVDAAMYEAKAAGRNGLCVHR